MLCGVLDKITHYTWRFGIDDLNDDQKTKVIQMYNRIANNKKMRLRLDIDSFDRRFNTLKSAAAANEGISGNIGGLREKLHEKLLLTEQVISTLNGELSNSDNVSSEEISHYINKLSEGLGSYAPNQTDFIAEDSGRDQVVDVDRYLADKITEETLLQFMDDELSFFDDESFMGDMDQLPVADDTGATGDTGADAMDVE